MALMYMGHTVNYLRKFNVKRAFGSEEKSKALLFTTGFEGYLDNLGQYLLSVVSNSLYKCQLSVKF